MCIVIANDRESFYHTRDGSLVKVRPTDWNNYHRPYIAVIITSEKHEIGRVFEYKNYMGHVRCEGNDADHQDQCNLDGLDASYLAANPTGRKTDLSQRPFDIEQRVQKLLMQRKIEAEQRKEKARKAKAAKQRRQRAAVKRTQKVIGSWEKLKRTRSKVMAPQEVPPAVARTIEREYTETLQRQAVLSAMGVR